MDLVGKVMSLLLNMLSRLVITFKDSYPVSTVNFIVRDYFIDPSVWICGCIASNNPFQKMQIGRQLLVYLKAIGKRKYFVWKFESKTPSDLLL